MRLGWLALPLLALGAPLAAQDHDHSAHGTQAAEPESPAEQVPEDHTSMDHGAMDHAAMGHAMPAPATADETPPPTALVGPRHAADRIWGESAMAPSRTALAREMGGEYRTASLLVERLEARIGEADGYLWDAQGFIGGDLDRFTFKTEGEGEFGEELEEAEVQALWSHAITPFVDLQAGARLDVEPETRGHAVIGLQGLAPYMVHFDGALFLSDKGDLTARIEAEHDWKLTQRLILQPRIEIEASAQDIPERSIGSGFTSVAAGLRLRYEIVREFAPYLGVEYAAATGKTADIARATGKDPGGVTALVGIRTWF